MSEPAPTVTAPQRDFSLPIQGLEAGTRHAGFTVTDVIRIPELSATAYVMRHDASGARALWLACADNNKSFSIAFKTAPSDNTGVFHILEHSVLCGSDRFPVKEPFVNLLKTSMQTFLHALTFPDKTMYPVASTNTADLENLMDVYLDAVLHPAIYSHPHIFQQEGWHLELQDADGNPAPADDPTARLAYNGVVFNEMKGALSDPDDVLFKGIDAALFPNTPYRFESGGDPRAIPTLTYEQFLQTHARHYNLANSYTILYGDLDVDRELAFIDSRFRQATQRDVGAPNPLPLQAPVTPALSRLEMATAPENASVGLAYVIGTSHDRERVLAADVLLDAIAGSNEAPLKRAVLDANLGDDFDAILYDGEMQPRVVFQLKGARQGVAQQFRTLVEDTCARLAADGIGREHLAASLAQAEFNLREGDWGSYSDGVALSMQIMSSWLYDDARPVDFLFYEDAIANMRAGLDQGYFEVLLRSLVCESNHSAEVELVPVESGSDAAEAAELAQRKAALSGEELQGIVDAVAELRAEQEAPDSPEDLAKLPHLSVADIEPAKPEPVGVRIEAPLPCVAHELDTRRIDYLYLYFDLRHLAFDDLPYVGLLTDLLGKLGTAKHTASELDTLVELNLGNLDFFCEAYSKDEDQADVMPALVVSASALVENVGKLATIPTEVWSATDFTDTDRILAILQQRRIALEQGFTNAGHSSAAARLSSYFSPASLAAQAMGGVDYYLFLKDLLAHFPERRDALAERLAALCRRIFVADAVTASFVGPMDDCRAYWQAGGTLGLPPADPGQAMRQMVIPTPTVRDEAFVIPSSVSFVTEGAGPSGADTVPYGVWNVATRPLSFDYLWNSVRVHGGAYGVGFRRVPSGSAQFWSYRDPSIDATIQRFEGTAAWLEGWEPAEEELAGYIVSTVASHDAPVKPRQMARRQDVSRLCGRPDSWRDQIRAQELATTASQIRAGAATLASVPSHRGICVFGSRAAIEGSKLGLRVINLMGAGEEDR